MRTGEEQRDSGLLMPTGTLSKTLKPVEIACFCKSSWFTRQRWHRMQHCFPQSLRAKPVRQAWGEKGDGHNQGYLAGPKRRRGQSTAFVFTLSPCSCTPGSDMKPCSLTTEQVSGFPAVWYPHLVSPANKSTSVSTAVSCNKKRPKLYCRQQFYWARGKMQKSPSWSCVTKGISKWEKKEFYSTQSNYKASFLKLPRSISVGSQKYIYLPILSPNSFCC